MNAPATSAPTTLAFKWDATNMACFATYNILELDDRLDQFDKAFIPFKDAGMVKLSSLPYAGAGLISPGDLHARVELTSRRFIRFVVDNYTNRKERASDSLVKLRADMMVLLKSKDGTIADLARLTDMFFKFNGE
jgi:hypothetical protein